MRYSFFLLAVLTLTLSTPAAPPPLATLADAQADFAAGQYRPCLQKIAGALAGPDGKPGSPARYDLLMLRGECMLRLKDNRMAADSFTSAANVAKSKQDRKKMADALAMSLLIKASKPTGYTPAGNPSAEPIDIVDPDSRKRALSAFFADTLAAAKPQIEQAAQANTLPPIEKQIPKMRELYALEVAATGDAAQTLPMARALGQHARDLLGAEFNRIAARLDELASAASAPVLLDGNRVTSSIITPRGLTTPERDELKQLASSLTQAERAAQQGRWIALQSDGPVQSWDALLADCSELKSRAEQLWARRY